MVVRKSSKIAQTARSHRERDLLQATQFERKVEDDLSTYSRAYRSTWRFKAEAAASAPGAWVHAKFQTRFVLPRLGLRFSVRAATVLLTASMAVKWAAPAFAECLMNPVITALAQVSEPYLHLGARNNTVRRNWDCSRQRVVRDTNGVVVAISPSPSCPAGVQPDYRSTALSKPVTREVTEAIATVEGQYQARFWTFDGVSISGWAAAAIGKGKRGRGGSSPMETGVKVALGMPGHLNLARKLLSGLQTIAFTSTMGSPAERDDFVVENLPCARGGPDSAFGPSVAGGLCLYVLFGKLDPQTISIAERCVVGASLYRQPVVVGPETVAEDRRDAKEINAAVIERAWHLCVENAKYDGVDRAQVRRELDAISQRFPFNPDALKTQASVDPAEQLKSALPLAGYLIADHLKIEQVEDMANVTLTLSSATQRAMAPQFETILKSLAPRVPELCTSNCDDPDKQIDAAVTIGEIKGDRIELVAAASNKFGLLNGRLRRGVNGGYEIMPPTRAVGSLNKPWLSPAIIRSGTTALCNQSFKNVHNAGKAADAGTADCKDAGAMVPAPFAYAHSMNLPFIWFANEMGGTEIRRFADQLGLTIADKLKDEDVPAGFVLGNAAVATPATLMRNFAGLYLGAQPKGGAVGMPTLFHDSGLRSRFDFASLGFDQKSLKGAANLLKAPIYHPTGGTLTSLAPVLSKLHCDQAIGKTGTPESVLDDGSKGARDKLVLAAFRCGQRDFVAFGLLGSPDIAVSVGQLASSDVVRLITVALSATLHSNGVTNASSK